MAKLSSKQIKEKILAANVGGAQLTDLPIEGAFKIESNEAGNMFLKPSKGARVNITERGLAALSIVEKKEDLAGISDTTTARESGKVSNLQTAISAEGVEFTDDTVLTVVGKLRRMNSTRPTEPIFKNRFYTGVDAYNKKVAEIRANDELSDEKRNQEYADASQALRATALDQSKNPVIEDKNLQLTPVFIMTAK